MFTLLLDRWAPNGWGQEKSPQLSGWFWTRRKMLFICHSSPLLYEVSKICQTSCYILAVVSCLFEEISGAETCIDVITRSAQRTPGKDRQMHCHKNCHCCHSCWCTAVRWVTGSALESIHFFWHAWKVLTLKTLLTCLHKTKAFLCSFTYMLAFAKCLFFHDCFSHRFY